MGQQISISPVGGLLSLNFKQKGIDLRKFGKADIRRTTEILWDTDRQQWYVKFLQGRRAGTCMTNLTLVQAQKSPQSNPHVNTADSTIYFDEYEDAVAEEIRTVQGLRKYYGVGEV